MNACSGDFLNLVDIKQLACQQVKIGENAAIARYAGEVLSARGANSLTHCVIP